MTLLTTNTGIGCFFAGTDVDHERTFAHRIESPDESVKKHFSNAKWTNQSRSVEERVRPELIFGYAHELCMDCVCQKPSGVKTS
jgi:hypothetical protein